MGPRPLRECRRRKRDVHIPCHGDGMKRSGGALNDIKECFVLLLRDLCVQKRRAERTNPALAELNSVLNLFGNEGCRTSKLAATEP